MISICWWYEKPLLLVKSCLSKSCNVHNLTHLHNTNASLKISNCQWNLYFAARPILSVKIFTDKCPHSVSRHFGRLSCRHCRSCATRQSRPLTYIAIPLQLFIRPEMKLAWAGSPPPSVIRSETPSPLYIGCPENQTSDPDGTVGRVSALGPVDRVNPGSQQRLWKREL